uniref:Uncharacterized protein n=1 Tax=Cyprinus carpio TaxID=7962 RepID=A0A8C1XTL5_CYPCA
MNPQCKLEKLDLWRCRITEKQCLILTSALKSNPSQLRELDLTENQMRRTGVNHLCDVLKDSHCKLERLRLRYCDMTVEACFDLTSALKSNPSHLRELDLSLNELGDSGFENLSDLLMNPLCKLTKLLLSRCSFTEDQCFILTSALKSNSSHLRELDVSENKMDNLGVNQLLDVLKDSHCKLERLRSVHTHTRKRKVFWYLIGTKLKFCLLTQCRLRCCDVTDEGCYALTSVLKSNPSHLRELDLSMNKLGDSGVKNLSDLLMNPQCKLEKLYLCGCSITEEQCLILTSALKSNPSHLRELDLSMNKIENTGVKHLCGLLKDSHCKLERLGLNDCGITDVSSLTQSLTNTKALQVLKELDLKNNNIGHSEKQLIYVLRDSNCKLRQEIDCMFPRWMTTRTGNEDQ